MDKKKPNKTAFFILCLSAISLTAFAEDSVNNDKSIASVIGELIWMSDLLALKKVDEITGRQVFDEASYRTDLVESVLVKDVLLRRLLDGKNLEVDQWQDLTHQLGSPLKVDRFCRQFGLSTVKMQNLLEMRKELRTWRQEMKQKGQYESWISSNDKKVIFFEM